jgi:hypothetical protein
MNQGKYVFQQLAEFLPRRVFDGMVEITWAIDTLSILLAGTNCYQ